MTGWSESARGAPAGPGQPQIVILLPVAPTDDRPSFRLLPLAAVACLLTVWATGVRLGLASSLRWVSDALDPAHAAASLLDAPWAWHPATPWFGAGRDGLWALLVLVAGSDGLPGLARVLAICGGLLPGVLTFALGRSLGPAWSPFWVAAVAALAGLPLVYLPDLLDTASSGFQGYASAGLCGAALAVALEPGRRTFRPWPVLGLLGGLATSNHLFAAPAALSAVLLRVILVGHARPMRALPSALGAFVLPLLPQALVVLSSGGPTGALAEAQLHGEWADPSYLAAARALLGGADREAARGLLLGPILLGPILLGTSLLAPGRQPARQRFRSHLGWAWLGSGVLAWAAAPLWVLLSHHVNPWHWRSHIPWAAGCWVLVAVNLPGAGSRFGRACAAGCVAIVSLTLVVGPGRAVHLGRQLDEGDGLGGTRLLDALGQALDERQIRGPLDLAGYAPLDLDPPPDLAALGLHLRLRGGPPLGPSASSGSGTLVLLQLHPEDTGAPGLEPIDELIGPPILRGQQVVAWWAQDPALARAAGLQLCEALPGSLRALSILEAVLPHDRTWADRIGPSASPCAVDPDATDSTDRPPVR